MIRDWRVSNDCSFSDHLYIDFNIEVRLPRSKPFQNRRKANWTEQNVILSQLLPNPPPINGCEDIESCVETLTNAFDQNRRNSHRMSPVIQ